MTSSSNELGELYMQSNSGPGGEVGRANIARYARDGTHIAKINIGLALEVAHRHAPRLAEGNVLVTIAVLLHLGRVGGVLV